MDKQKLKNNLNILTGRTANKLNKMFILIANSGQEYAKLHFKDQTMWYYEDAYKAQTRKVNQASGILSNTALPNKVLQNYAKAEKIKKQIESIGVSGVQLKYSDEATEYTDDGANVIHMFYLEFPIDALHRKNRFIAMSMMLKDHRMNCYIPGRDPR